MLDLSRIARTAVPALALAVSLAAQAQSSCSSDGQPRPVALLERFINADCETCWVDAKTPVAKRGEVALDWIVPGSKGDDAPLSAAATRDAQWRLDALHRPAPVGDSSSRMLVTRGDRGLRVAHGLPFNGYVGTSIELKPGADGPWHAWLVLVETVPAGAEGSPVERNLVRNAFQPPWDSDRPPSNAQRQRLFESRPMSIPEGANPKRLRVVGWVEDGRGRIVSAAESFCAGK